MTQKTARWMSQGCQRRSAVRRFCAGLPFGASRHHWGTEVDYYDPFRLPADIALQLEPREYEEGGYFAALSLAGG